MQRAGHSSRRTLASLRVGGDARNNCCAETLEVAVVLVIADIVARAEAHYLKPPSSHCALARELDAPTAAPHRKKESHQKGSLSPSPAQGVKAKTVL